MTSEAASTIKALYKCYMNHFEIILITQASMVQWIVLSPLTWAIRVQFLAGALLKLCQNFQISLFN